MSVRHKLAVLLALAILQVACSGHRSLASPIDYEQLARELYGDAESDEPEATTVCPTPASMQSIPLETRITESYAAHPPVEENDRPLDDDPNNFLPDDLSAEEITEMINARQQALAQTVSPLSYVTRKPESLMDRQAREAHERMTKAIKQHEEAKRREQARLREEARQREEAQRRERARLLEEAQRREEARLRAQSSPYARQRYMDEMFGPPVTNDEDVQRIAERLLREQERDDIEASKKLPADYRHLDGEPAFDQTLAKAEEYKPKEADEECRICLEPLRDGQSIKLACGDAFHTVCLKRWIQAQKTNLKECPTCRKPVKL